MDIWFSYLERDDTRKEYLSFYRHQCELRWSGSANYLKTISPLTKSIDICENIYA